MTSSITDENIIDQNFLGLQDQDQDILDEFLDHRVYDSLGNNSPASVHIKAEHNDLFGDFAPSESNDYVKFHESFANTPQNNNSVSGNNNDYLYVDPHQYQNSTPSIYASPYETKQPISESHETSQLSPNTSQVPDSVSQLPVEGSQISSQLADYDKVRDELSKLKFGNHNMDPCPKSVDVPDPSYLDFSSSAMNQLPYKLLLAELPSYSRVETQIKLKLYLSPPPPHVLLHIPQDLISKNKFSLNEPIENISDKLKENLLYLDTYVMTSDLSKSCSICSRCIKREQKRASRRKSGHDENIKTENGTEYNTPNPNGGNSDNEHSNNNAGGVVKNNPNSWADEKMMKKAIIFNCKEIVSFPSPNGLNNGLSKCLELSARIICYCRHHKESEGFKLLFVVKDSHGDVVAKQLSSSIMIMDRKKNNNSSNKESHDSPIAHSTNSHAHPPSENEVLNKSGVEHPLSPNSIDESGSTNTDIEGRGLKRKKLSIDDSYNTSSNPMFNGSVNGFSPTSNSDTNTSANNMMLKPNIQQTASSLHPPPQPQFALPNLGSSSIPQSLQSINSSNNSSTQLHNLPSIQRIIPAQGPVRGGIEVTLLGCNFRPGLSVKFGANHVLATHCWSDSTIVTYLPPAAQAGQVLVSFENHEHMMLGGVQQQQIFTYTDDTDRQLIELALQIVGLKMNGKLEDAKNIARRIVGSDGTNGNPKAPSTATTPGGAVNQANEWYDSAHKAVEQLTKSDLSTQDILISFLSLVDLPNCPIIIPNWQLCNNQGQGLLHLATLKNYKHLIRFLITHGCKIDLKDNQGITPLFLASMCGYRDLIDIFIDCKSNWNLKLSNDKYLKDYCDLNVLDVFNNLELSADDEDFTSHAIRNLNNGEEEKGDQLSKSISLDSLSSLFTMSYGRHISRMVTINSVNGAKKLDNGDRHIVRQEFKPVASSSNENYSSDFADSEYDSNDDELNYGMDDDYDEFDEDYEDDYSDYETTDDEISMDENDDVTSTNSTIIPGDDGNVSSSSANGLWQKVKNVFNNDQDKDLPSYDDLFPVGSSFTRPKTLLERRLNDISSPTEGSSTSLHPSESEEAGSDSSEDLMVSYINRPRKNVENDKMLLFFWLPILVIIIGLFLYMSIMGYKVQTIENFKFYMRSTIGNLMVGHERLGRVFNTNSNGVDFLHATRRILNE